MGSSSKLSNPWYIYVDPITGVLKNLRGITNANLLHRWESHEAAEQIMTLREKSPKINTMKDVQQLHKFIFGNIYGWAGKFRKVNMGKGDSNFLPIAQFDRAVRYMNNLLSEYKLIDEMDNSKIAEYLANILDDLNHFHPFREGNGRTQRLAIELLAKEKGYDLNLNPPDNRNMYDDYMRGSIEENRELFTDLIYSNLEHTK
jgi:cell filamentation protein